MSIQIDTFSARLLERRSKLGISQSDLAQKAEIGTAILSRYERGVATPKKATLFKLAQALQCSPEWLEIGVNSSQDGSDLIDLRISHDLFNRLESSAVTNQRTISSEVIQRLELSLINDIPDGEVITAEQANILRSRGLKDAPNTILAICFKEISKCAKLGRHGASVEIGFRFSSYYLDTLRKDGDILTREIVPQVINKLEQLGYTSYFLEEESRLNITFEEEEKYSTIGNMDTIPPEDFDFS
jgi:transcriptional regulator with XRE-family HTH domain